MARLAVIGAGIAGLAAAHEGQRQHLDTVVFEAADRVGGKIRASTFAGQLVDEAADAFLARVPWALELCDELGLTAQLTEPAARSAFVWSRGELRRLPTSQLLGVPTDLDELGATGIVSAEGLERARHDLEREDPAPTGDPSIGEFLRDRLGDEVVDRLVGPLVGGINAGDVDRLSLRASAAQIAGAADRGGSLVAAATAIRSGATDPTAPVFHAPRGGMTQLVDALRRSCEETVEIRTGTPVDRLRPTPAGWLVGDEPDAFDHVVVAVPAGAAAELVANATKAASILSHIDYASVAMVTLAFDPKDIDHPLDGSGFLVPAIEGRFVTACSFASSKWAHLRSDDTAILRVSAGRDGDPEPATDLADPVLLASVLGDLDDFLGVGAPPIATRISRWPESLPQYRPGHLDRVDDLDASVSSDLPGVVVVGAALRGLGIPACIQQGRSAVRRLTAR